MKKLTDYKNELEGIEFLRDAMYFFDNRAEVRNENKTPLELLEEYLKVHRHVA